MASKPYGKSLILDIHDCDASKFNRKDLKKYFVALCARIGMVRAKLVWWDFTGQPEAYEQAPPHLKGTSAVQFISTSNVTIHALDDLRCAYVDIFSCRDFDDADTAEFTASYFGGKIKAATPLVRH